MDNFKHFLQSHSSFFIKYPDISSINASSACKWLYLFDVAYYNGELTVKLPENTIKFGETKKSLLSRLKQYNTAIGMKNIEAIQCNYPEEREALLKRYIRMRTYLIPVSGKEYFCNCKDYIKILILIIVSLSDEDIILFDTYYTSDNILYALTFDTITNIYNNIKTTERYVLDIDIQTINAEVIENKQVEEFEYKCQYCGNIYSNVYTLNNHQQTARFCLALQNKENTNTHDCTFCDEHFTSKQTLTKHFSVCKEKKRIDEEKRKVEVEEQIHKLTEELHNYKSKYEEMKLTNQELTTKYSLSLQKIELLGEKIESLCEKVQEKDKRIDQLNATIKEKDSYIHEKDKYIQEHSKVTNIYNNTSQNTTQYNINIQDAFEKLTPFTEENVKNKVKSIQPISLIENNNYNLMKNFYINFGRALSDMVILIDEERGLLLVKNKDGNQQKYKSRSLIQDAFEISEHECKRLFNRTSIQLDDLVLDKNITNYGYSRALNDLTLLYYYIVNKTMDTTVQGISNVLKNHCVYISKRLPNQLMDDLD